MAILITHTVGDVDMSLVSCTLMVRISIPDNVTHATIGYQEHELNFKKESTGGCATAQNLIATAQNLRMHTLNCSIASVRFPN